MKRSKKSWLIPTLAITTLLGLKIHGMSEIKPDTAAPFHQEIKDAFRSMPYAIGAWVGADSELDTGSINLLHPNAFIRRNYTNSISGILAQYMLIQCQDANLMVGHYPANCYPNQGWEQNYANPVDFTVDGETIPMTEYRFTFRRKGLDSNTIIVYDLMVLPDGKIVRDHSGINATAKSYRWHYFGVAQLQIVFDDKVQKPVRSEAVVEFLRASKPLIDKLKSGVPR